jgi:hypothetical protein
LEKIIEGEVLIVGAQYLANEIFIIKKGKKDIILADTLKSLNGKNVIITIKTGKKTTRKSSPKEARNYMKSNEALLERASEHIYYEIEKLNEAWNYFKPNDYPQAFIEIFLLHSRNLMDFFYPAEDIEIDIDNVIVFDFLDDYEGFNSNKTLKKDLSLNKRNINKFLSHLTYARCYFSEIWLIPEFTEEIIKTINAFYIVLPPNYRNWYYFKKIPGLLKSIEEKKGIETLMDVKFLGGHTSSDFIKNNFSPRKLL